METNRTTLSSRCRPWLLGIMVCTVACDSSDAEQQQAPIPQPLAGNSGGDPTNEQASGAQNPIVDGDTGVTTTDMGPATTSGGAATPGTPGNAGGAAAPGAAPGASGSAGGAAGPGTNPGGAGNAGGAGNPAPGSDSDPATDDGANADPDQGADTMADADPDPGTGTDMEPATMFEACVSGDTGPCGSFTHSSGTELEFGPHGAIMEVNVGQGYEAQVSPNDTASGCAAVAASFGEPGDSTSRVLDIGDLDLSLYTVYRPAARAEGETFPLVVWGNGTCAAPEGYGALLRYVASHGYVVVAPNSRYTGYRAPMVKAVDFMFAANDDPESPYHGLVNKDLVGGMGHSQGGGATVSFANDARVTSVILFNGGTSASKPFLAVSGDADIAGRISGFQRAVQNASVSPAAFLWYHMIPETGRVSGHLTLMTQPERVVEATVAWWDLTLKGEESAKAVFAGSDCQLCGRDAEFEFGLSGLQP